MLYHSRGIDSCRRKSQRQARSSSPGPSATTAVHGQELSTSNSLRSNPRRVDTGTSSVNGSSVVRSARLDSSARHAPEDLRISYDAAFHAVGNGSHPRDTIKWAESLTQPALIPEDVEARINFLKKQVRRLSGERISDPDANSRGFVEKVPLAQAGTALVTPVLRTMPWYEWMHTKASWDEDAKYVIEVLAEDSVLASEAMRNKAKKPPPDDATRAELLEKLLKTKTQPERIRINSWYLQRILEMVSGNDRLAPLDRALVLLRPFKILLYHDGLIHDEYERLRERWESVDGDSESHKESHDDNDEESTDCQQAFLNLGCLIKFMDEFITPMQWSTEDEIPV